MSDLFISYAAENSDLANSITSEFARLGFSVLSKPELAAADTYAELLEAAVEETAAVIVLWTKESIGSPSVLAEATAADKRQKLVSIRADDLAIGDIPLAFRNWPLVYTMSELRELLQRSQLRNAADLNKELRKLNYENRVVPASTPSTGVAAASVQTNTQAERDELYRRRMAENDDPQTLDSAPRREEPPTAPPAAGGFFVSNAALSVETMLLSASAVTEHITAAFAPVEPASTGSLRRPIPGLMSSRNSATRISATRVLRDQKEEARHRFDSAYRDYSPPAHSAPGPHYSSPTRKRRFTWLILGLAAVALLPLFSRTIREQLTGVLTLVGLKLNAMSFGGLLGRKVGAKIDVVDCSVFSPPAAAPQSTVLVQVFLHVPAHAERAKFAATMMDTSAELKAIKTLETKIARGARVTVALSCRNVEIDEPEQAVTWQGEPVFCQFLVTLPQNARVAALHPMVRIAIDGAPVGRIAFRLGVDPGSAKTQSRKTGERAQNYNHAFLSYAAANRNEVLKRAQALQATGITFFQDILSLDPGQRWEGEIFKHLDACDLFLLFWSRAAKHSEFVMKEVEYALARQRSGDVLDIVPIILEGPPPVLPPPSLGAIHFNDRIRYLMSET